jgi:hypothetical protein
LDLSTVEVGQMSPGFSVKSPKQIWLNLAMLATLQTSLQRSEFLREFRAIWWAVSAFIEKVSDRQSKILSSG